MSERGLVVMLAPFGLRPKATLSRRALPLAVELVRSGFRVHVLAPSDLWPADAGSMVELDGVLIEHSPRFGGPLAMLRSSLWMLRRVRQLRPALLHLFKPKGYGGIAAALLRCWPGGRRPPLVVDTDDWEGRGGWNERLPYPAPIKLLIDWQERTLPLLADVVSVASATLAEQVRGFGVAAERITYLPNGVALPGRALPDRAAARQMLGLGGEPVILLYTRFWEFALRDVLEFLVALNALHPAARLLVIGAGENGEERRLAAWAARAGVAHVLDQRGWADESLIAAALAASDLALYPMADTLINRAKCSAKLTEQMQAGLPVVAAGVGQVAEYIVDGVSGSLTPPANGVALARAAVRLLHDPPLARRMGAAACARVEAEFNWPRLARELIRMYDDVLALSDSLE